MTTLSQLLTLSIIGILFGFVIGIPSATTPISSTHLTVNNEGINSALKLVIPRVCQLLSIIDLPSFHDTLHIPVIGDVQLDLTDMHIKEVSLGELTLKNEESASNAFSVQLAALNISLEDNWHYRESKFPHIEGHGTSTITVQGASALVQMQMMTDENGKSFLWIAKPQDLTLELGDIHVEIHGGISGAITQALAKVFGNLMKPLIAGAIRDALVKEVNVDLKDMLQSLGFTFPVDWSGFAPHAMEWNLKLTDNPIFGNTHALFEIIGDWNIDDVPTPEPSFQPGKLPREPMHNDAMINVFMSDFVLGDFFWTAVKGNLLQWHITNDMVPPESPYKLNTASLKYIFPQLYQKYNDSNLTMDVRVPSQPKIAVNSAGGLSAQLNATLEFHVILANQSTTPAFRLNTALSLQVDALGLLNVEQGKALNITGHVNDLSIVVDVLESWIGDIDVGYIQNQIKIIVTFGYLPKLNAQLKEGINQKLPETILGQLSLSNTELAFQDGFVDFATSFALKSDFLSKRHASFTEEEKVRHQIWRLEKELLKRQEELNHLVDSHKIPVL